MTPKRRAPRARRARTTLASLEEKLDESMRTQAESIRALGVQFEDQRKDFRVVIEALQDCVKRSEFNERFDSVENRLGGVETELVGVRKGLRAVEYEVRALRHESTDYARAEDVRAPEQRVTALERSSA